MIDADAMISSRRTTAILLGMLVALCALGFAIRNDVLLAEQRFDTTSADAASTLTRQFDDLNATLRSLSNTHYATNNLSQQELSAYAQGFERSHPYIDGILQVQRVNAAQRESYESQFREGGYPTYAIRDSQPDGRLTIAPYRPEHMVLKFIEPLEPGLARFLGLDFYSQDALRQGIGQAIRTGDIAAAPAGFLRPGTFLLLVPVYKGFFVPDNIEDRQTQAYGAYALLVNSRRFLAGIRRNHPRLSVTISAFDGQRQQVMAGLTPSRTPGSLDRVLPTLRGAHDIRLAHAKFVFSFEKDQDGSIFHPLKWLALTAMLMATYAALVTVVLTRLRAREQALEAKEQLFQEKERAQVTLQSIGEAVITTDPTGVVDFMNPMAEHLTGWRAEAAHGRHLNEIFSLVSESDGRALPDPIARALRDHDESEAAAIMLRSDGATIAVIENAAAIRDSDGHFTGAALIVRDVSRERSLLREMAFQASHDPLTRLINRRQFERELAMVIEDALNSNNQHALMYIDLDQFKAINDSSGHMAGDQLLKQVAGHLGENIRRLDRLARLGGDEFGVLLRDCTLDRALEVAESLRHEIKDVRLHWEDKTFRVSLSIGVVSINKDSGNLDEVLRAADAACYVAKDQGRNRVHCYQPDDDLLAQRSTDMQWLQRLRDSIDQNRLVLHGQSIFPLGNSHLRHPVMCELLVRMLDDDGRTVPPMTFIPAAERFNLMFDLDLWVIGEAFRRLARLWKTHPADPRIFTINLSGQSLDHPDLETSIQALQDKQEIQPHKICFEITETSVIANMDRALAMMDLLRRRGFLFALDDFGTGLSSFAYLKKLPVDFLKIDGEFVRDILDDPVDKAMVDTIRRIGGVLGMTTIAESIEDEETCKLLTAMGIDYGQGYFLGKPGAGRLDPTESNVVALPRQS